MFQKTVGSDAGLVLSGVLNTNDVIITLDQTFTIDDLKSALKLTKPAIGLAR